MTNNEVQSKVDLILSLVPPVEFFVRLPRSYNIDTFPGCTEHCLALNTDPGYRRVSRFSSPSVIRQFSHDLDTGLMDEIKVCLERGPQ